MHFSRNAFDTEAINSADSMRLWASTGIITLSSKFPLAPAHVIVASLPIT